jgi:hypothetical protein
MRRRKRNNREAFAVGREKFQRHFFTTARDIDHHANISTPEIVFGKIDRKGNHVMFVDHGVMSSSDFTGTVALSNDLEAVRR